METQDKERYYRTFSILHAFLVSCYKQMRSNKERPNGHLHPLASTRMEGKVVDTKVQTMSLADFRTSKLDHRLKKFNDNSI